MKKIVLAALLAWGVIGHMACSGGKKEIGDLKGGKNGKGGKEASEKPKYDRYWNDLARLLAGKERLAGSVLDSIDNGATAQQHRDFFKGSLWQQYRDYLKKVEAFAQAEFPEEHKSDRVMLYPFSGPDFITAHALFPNARKYVFWGLEPEGQLPNIREIPKDRLDHNLKSIQHSLRTIMRRSFFVTSEMGGDFRRAELNGSLPIILTFMAERGNEVLNVERIKINMNGELEPIGKDASYGMGTNDSLVTGMRYLFRRSEDAPVQELIYIVFDAQDFPAEKRFSRHTELIKWLRGLGRVSTYFKSGSYVIQWESTNTLRALITDITDFFFQDDTGLRYGQFDLNTWDITLYGNYVPPVPPFTTQFERPLAQAYATKKHPVKPVSFQMGYQQGRGEDRTSLIMARRKPAEPAAPAQDKPQEKKPAGK
ncbi:MAG: hypothetical protein KF690_01230 [Bacteroidetes bacterium]|nr:hypothetical protein [Bacteroidota bacterium]